MLIQINNCYHTPVVYDWEKQEEMGQETFTLSWESACLARAVTAWLQIASLLWAPGISTNPFTAKETRQAVKNNHTVKSWKGREEETLIVEVNRPQGTMQWLEKCRASSSEARNTSSNKMCLTCPHHKWSLGWPGGPRLTKGTLGHPHHCTYHTHVCNTCLEHW